MCIPAAAALPFLIASTAVSSVGAVVGGIGAQQQANYQASIDEQNRQRANAQAQDSITNTNLEAQRRYRQQAQTMGNQQAAMAANGVDLSFGTALDVQRDTAMIGAEDIGQIYKAGNERTKGFEVNAFNYASDAAAQRAKGSSALMQGIIGGLGTALGGASQVAMMKAPQGGGVGTKIFSNPAAASFGIDPRFA